MANAIPIERRGPAAWLTIPAAFGLDTARHVADACAALRDDNSVRVVVVTGAAESFSSGWDYDALAAERPLGEALRAAGALGDPFGCLADLPQPVIAAINGDAIAGGLALALACDIRIASESARFSLPESARGLLPAAGATQRLTRLAGRGNALALILSGEPIDAAEAHRIGLVGGVVPADKLPAEAERIAGVLAQRGPLALRYAKEAVSRGIDMPLEQALRFETDLTVILQTTEDRAEGVRAFLEKRPPEFKGK